MDVQCSNQGGPGISCASPALQNPICACNTASALYNDYVIARCEPCTLLATEYGTQQVKDTPYAAKTFADTVSSYVDTEHGPGELRLLISAADATLAATVGSRPAGFVRPTRQVAFGDTAYANEDCSTATGAESSYYPQVCKAPAVRNATTLAGVTAEAAQVHGSGSGMLRYMPQQVIQKVDAGSPPTGSTLVSYVALPSAEAVGSRNDADMVAFDAQIFAKTSMFVFYTLPVLAYIP